MVDSLLLVFSTVYVVTGIVAVYLSYSIYYFYKDLPIKTYLQLFAMSIIAFLFSIIYPLTYFYRLRIELDNGYIYLLDTIVVLLVLLFFLIMMYVLEKSEHEHVTFRFTVFFGIATAVFIAELVEIAPWVFLISGSLEALAFIYFLFFFGRYLLRLHPYVEDQKAFLSGIGGYLFITFGALIGVSLSVIYVFIPSSVVYVTSELASFPILVGIILILYAIKRRPLSPLAILANPISFSIIDRDTGKVIYSYYMQRSITEIEEKMLSDLLEGVYLSVSEMFKEDVCLKYISIEGYTIIAKCGRLISGFFVAKKSNAVIREIVEMLVKVFEEEVAKYHVSGELAKINIEELAKFDYIVKYYLTQVAR